jgi:hypothetical protein
VGKLDDDEETITFKTGELTPETLAKTAKSFFKRHGEIGLEESEGTVIAEALRKVKVVRTPAGWLDLLTFAVGGKSETIEKTILKRAILVSAGSGLGENGWFRIESLKDLGVAIRLSTLSGVFAFQTQSFGKNALESAGWRCLRAFWCC